jgi:metal-dependent amidase/aminoacylase/carboxypeptidase family protein
MPAAEQRPLGCRNRTSRPQTANIHNPRYDFNDAVLPIGASYWVRLAEQELRRKVA